MWVLRIRSVLRRVVRVSTVAMTVVVLAPSISKAQLVLSEVVVDFPPGERTPRDIEMRNTSEVTQYVSVSVFRIDAPDTEAQRRVPLNDPRKAGLLASPQRVIMAPGARRLLRLIPTRPADATDTIYRVRVTPQRGEQETTETGVRLQVAYDVLVIVRPAGGAPDLKVRRDGTRLTLVNEGNSSILIRSLRQCAEDQSDCVDLKGNRLYAGEAWKVSLPRDAPVEVHQSIGTSNRLDIF